MDLGDWQDGPVLAEIDRGTLIVRLNRPERGNGWTGTMTRAYFGLLQAAARAAEVRAIVVTGAGKAFCVGGDGEKLESAASSGDTSSSQDLPYWLPLQIGKPIIAAINGACFGIGLQQALCCDLRFASEEAKFSTAYARRGLPAEFGMSWLLPRLVGTGNAMDLLLSARLIRAPEALSMSLVNRLVPADDLLAEAITYAQQLAEQCSPRAMQAIKRQCYADLMSSLPGSYDRSEELLRQATAEGDFKEGVMSWRENRAPQFPALPEDLAFIDYE